MSHHGVLSGHEIQKQIQKGRIRIDPYDLEQINPASYDLTLGEGVKTYNVVEALDSRAQNPTSDWIIPRDGIVLRPGVGYLMHTRERVWTDTFVPVVDGKSSIGRLFIAVHITAGYIDAGFDGHITLEVTAVHPVRVYAGMRICQIRFHTIAGEVMLYKGHYQGATATGAVASRSWEQYRENRNLLQREDQSNELDRVEQEQLSCKGDHEAARRSEDGCELCGYYAK